MKNVLLVDASVIRQDGKQQNQQRIHLCYSLNENRMKQVKVSDQHTAESLAHFSMKKGDLAMADAVYGTAQNLIYAQEQGADVILRITPKNFCLYNAEGEKISLTALLKEAEEKHMEWIDVWGFCRYKGKTGFVRVIAYRLPDEQAAKARKRKIRKASKNQHQIQAETLLWLIIWTIVERQSFQAECFLAEKQECSQSVYERCKITFIQITDILCLSWSLILDLTDKKYTRYLSKKQRRRINQNDEFHSAVLPGLLS